MDATVVLVLVVGSATVLLAAGVWLATGRAGAMAEAASARAELERAGRELVTTQAALAQARAQEKDLADAVSRAGMELSRLNQELEHEQADRATERAYLEQRAEHEMKTALERCERDIAAREAILQERLAAVEREKVTIAKKLEEFEAKLRESFGALAAEALKSNREQFLALAEQKLEAKRSAVDGLVRPIAETLAKQEQKLAVIEAAGTELKTETGKLVRALREPHVRGRYGELQLRRVAELAGMTAYCDFAEQEQTRGMDGTPLRPDMVVRMPSDRVVVVDAKTNIQAYVDAMSAGTPEESEKHLERFARHVGEQATALARKRYWTQYDGSPEFVVMFIPGDQFIDAALRRDQGLLERAAEHGVILASPSTLIGLLRAVAVGYKEQALTKQAAELRELGKELHARVATLLEHAAKIGRGLEVAAGAYNDFVGSYERRVEPQLRRFEDGGVKGAKELPSVPTVSVVLRRTEGQGERDGTVDGSADAKAERALGGKRDGQLTLGPARADG